MKVAQWHDIEPYRAGLVWKQDDLVIRHSGRCVVAFVPVTVTDWVEDVLAAFDTVRLNIAL
ncbi:MAG: hypothetical protein ABSC65_12405 [Acidobacteriaceae bacterium]|jgi:hypothetical protein